MRGVAAHRSPPQHKNPGSQIVSRRPIRSQVLISKQAIETFLEGGTS